MRRWSFLKKDCVEDCLTLDTKFLRKEGYFDRLRAGIISWYRNEEKTSSISIENIWDEYNQEATGLRLKYTTTHRYTVEKTDSNYVIHLSRDPCNFGGYRYYLICPLVKNGIPCGRRCTKLFIAPGGIYFGCRICYDLTYESCQTHDKRVGWLMKNPELIELMLNSPNHRNMFLALKAAMLLENKFKE